MTAVLWSTTDKGSNASIDSTQLILTPVSGGSMSGVRATAGYTTGKYYFETTLNGIDSTSYSNMGAGVSTASADISPTATTVGLAELYLYGGVYINNSNAGRIFSGSGGGSYFSAGDVMGVAVDLDARRIYFSRNGTFASGQNPAAGTGGLDISALTGALYPMGFIQYAGDQLTANFGSTAFSGSIPRGYRAWTPLQSPIYRSARAGGYAAGGTFTLPAGTTIGDLTIVMVVLSGTSTGNIIGAPSGWTTIVRYQQFAVFYRVFQSGDPSTAVFTSTSGSYANLLGISYSNVDTASPIDDYNSCYIDNNAGGVLSIFRAPAVHPNFNGSQLVCLYAPDTSSGIGAPASTPSGVTMRTYDGSGPCGWIGDAALADGTSTGNNDLTWSGTNNHFGMAIAVKGNGATAATPATEEVTVAGVHYIDAGSATQTYDFSVMQPKQDDLIAVLAVGNSGGSTPPSAPSGWSTNTKNLSGLFTKVWNTGDPTNPTITYPTTSYSLTLFMIFRKRGSVTTGKIGLGNVAVNDNSPSGTSLTSPTVVPFNTKDLLCCFVADSLSSGVTFTPPAGLDAVYSLGTGPGLMVGTMAPSANPSGSYTTTISSSARLLTGITATVAIGASGGGGGGTTHRPASIVIAS